MNLCCVVSMLPCHVFCTDVDEHLTSIADEMSVLMIMQLGEGDWYQTPPTPHLCPSFCGLEGEDSLFQRWQRCGAHHMSPQGKHGELEGNSFVP